MPSKEPSSTRQEPAASLTFRNPDVRDGAEIWRLVREGGVLELNSCYAYLLFCSDFRDTCVVAEEAGRLAGFVIAYRPPRRPGSVFVWQVGVSPHFRKRGIGVRLLRHLVMLPACREVEYLEATVAPSNVASRRLFESVARQLGATLRTESGFESSDFGAESHEKEELVRIGPLHSGS